MATAGPFNPSANSEDTSAGTISIPNKANAYTSNDVYAGPAGNGTTYWGIWTGFGITSSDVPNDATINGILFEVEASRNNINSGNITAMRPVKAGVLAGTDQGPTTLTTTDTYYNYGGASSLLGTTWTPSDIQNSGFGIAMQINGTAMGQARIDHIRVTIYYTAAAGGVTVQTSKKISIFHPRILGGNIIR